MELKETKYLGYYAGSDGHIYSSHARKGNVKEPVRLKSNCGSSGYLQIAVKTPLGFKTVMVHSLICETWNGSRPTINDKKMTCSHLDGDKLNNSPSNLIWESHKDNLSRKINHGTSDYGHLNSRAKLSAADIEKIRERLMNKEKHSDIALDYDVTRATISKINNKSRYAKS